MASEEVVIEPHSRLLALVPFGAGQLQNGEKTLGWTLLASEGALLATTGVLFLVYRVDVTNASDAHAAGDQTREQGWIDRAKAARVANLVVNGVLGATALAGIVQAQVAFVSERRDKKVRAIPPAVTLAPLVAPVTGVAEGTVRGGMMGVVGTF
jgi:hypothetical protein